MENYSREEHKQTYLRVHGKRFAYLLSLIDALGVRPEAKVLDVGRSPFTKLLTERFSDVTTLGLEEDSTLLDKTDPVDHAVVPHVVYDLNRCADESTWKIDEQYDLILFAEVLEHLYLSPLDAFRYLRRCLKPSGILICQTPNAASISKRIKLLAGRNPYSIFDPDAETASHHFREYTKAEIVHFLERAGLTLVSHSYNNYFTYESSLKSLFHGITALVPPFRNGQTFVISRRD